MTVVVRQRNQVAIRKPTAEQAGLTEGAVVDFQYANGVITVTLPGHAAEPADISRWAGKFDGVWGCDQDEIDRNIRETRDSADRHLHL